MRVIVGLGNPGKEYDRTPHNLGFAVIETLAARCSIKLKGSKTLPAKIGEGSVADKPIILLKPVTYMNLSGEAVRPLLESGSFKAEDFLVVCDDINLPVGKLRLRQSGSAGGHKGLQSIIDALNTIHIARLRLGVKPPDEEIEDWVKYVLSPIPEQFRVVIDEIILLAVEVIEFALCNTIEKAMSRYNRVNLITKLNA